LDAVSRFTRRALLASAALVAAAAASGPIWAWGRPDRMGGFALGAAASLVRFAWSVYLARGVERSRPSRYASSRAAGLAPLAAALVVAGMSDRVDLASAAVGVFLATAAALIAAAFELRRSTSFAEAKEADRSLGEGRSPVEEAR
jgi:hypothetical protein